MTTNGSTSRARDTRMAPPSTTRRCRRADADAVAAPTPTPTTAAEATSESVEEPEGLRARREEITAPILELVGQDPRGLTPTKSAKFLAVLPIRIAQLRRKHPRTDKEEEEFMHLIGQLNTLRNAISDRIAKLKVLVTAKASTPGQDAGLKAQASMFPWSSIAQPAQQQPYNESGTREQPWQARLAHDSDDDIDTIKLL